MKNSRVVRRNIIPISRGGLKGEGTNITYIKTSVNNGIDKLFGNQLPHEQGVFLMNEINQSVLRDDIKDKLNKILLCNDQEYYYYNEALGQDFEFTDGSEFPINISKRISLSKRSIHHIIARSKGGHISNKTNLKLMSKESHDGLHRIFHNMLPHEQLFFLMNEINYPVLTNHFLNDLYRLVKQFNKLSDFYIDRSLKSEHKKKNLVLA